MKSLNKIVVIGECFMDVWLEARAERRSAEVDIPIWDIYKEHRRHGGAGNVLQALKNLDIDNLKGMFPKEWPIKTRILVDGKQVARFDRFDSVAPIEFGEGGLQDSLVVISDYNKGAITEGLLEYAAKEAGEIWVNTKLVTPMYECLDLARKGSKGPAVSWLCNWGEFSANPDFYGRQNNVWVSRSEKGISYYPEAGKGETSKKSFSLGAYAKNVVSVCGAGDVTLAALVKGRLLGFESWEMADLAMRAAAIAVENNLTYTPSWKEIENYGQG